MPIVRDILIDIDAADVLRHEGGLRNESVAESAGWAARQCKQLAGPALTYRFLPVKRLARRQLVVDHTSLDIGPQVKLLQGAAEILIGVVTLGPALEEAVGHLNADGKILEAYLLDLAGVTALSLAAKEFERRAERRAAERRWGVGAVLSPGSLAGWPLEGQRDLCALLDLAPLQVELSSSGVLLPFKSMSVLIGLGPGYTGHKVQEACCHCTLKMTCRHRGDNRPAAR